MDIIRDNDRDILDGFSEHSECEFYDDEYLYLLLGNGGYKER